MYIYSFVYDIDFSQTYNIMDIILELSNTQYSYEMIIIENIMDITQNVKWIQI